MRYNLYRNMVMDAEFREEEHPRDDDGKFTNKGSSGSSGGKEESSYKKEKKQMRTAKGIKERADNYRWFVKEVKSKVSNEDVRQALLEDIEERMFDLEDMDDELFLEVLVKNDVPEKEINNIMGEGENKKLDNGGSGGKVYKNTMSKVRKFKAKSDGTYDFETGKVKEYPDGYSVSFHQNEPDENGKWKSDYGRYTEEDYDKNVADLVKESGGELNIGYFSGTPEVSVWVKGIREAKKLMKKHNQKSIWDWKAMDEIPNPKYDPKKNPMKE